MTLILASTSALPEKVLVLVALVSWLVCAVTMMQSAKEVRQDLVPEKARNRRLEAIFVAPKALTPRGHALRKRMLVFGTLFILAVLALASLLARPRHKSAGPSSSVVSFEQTRG